MNDKQNQCDGCMAGVPVKNNMHYVPYPSGSMSCQKEKYMNNCKWFKCSDRLPEGDCWVLVYADGAMNCMAFVNRQWKEWTAAKAHNINIDEITHWMYLPEPPEEN